MPDIFAESDAKELKDLSYIDEYQQFLERFDNTQTSGAEIGEVIARMSQHFARYNLMMARSLKLYTRVAKDCHAQIDGNNGKPISAAKAEVVASATDEAAAYQEARVHVQNIEQNINALKALQRGILNEYTHQ